MQGPFNVKLVVEQTKVISFGGIHDHFLYYHSIQKVSVLFLIFRHKHNIMDNIYQIVYGGKSLIE